MRARLKWSSYIPETHKPHPQQALFLSLDVREAFYGGAAGGGKSDALLMGALQYSQVPGYAALLLRKTYSDLSMPKALMDRALEWLRPTDAHWSVVNKRFTFPSGATITFGNLDSENDKFKYQSAEFQYIGFDELTQFTETQYTYLFSRLRRLMGVEVPLRMRAASNPGGAGHEWVRRRFIDKGAPGAIFVPARMTDNPSLDQIEYMKSLSELDPVTREQLLNGDWDVRKPGGLFDREWFTIIEPHEVPDNLQMVRYWDCAATERKDGNDPDATAGVKLGKGAGADVIVLDVRRDWKNPGGVEDLIKRTAEADGPHCAIRMEQEPGSSGKAVIAHYARELSQYDFRGIPSSGSKGVRAGPASAACNNRLLSVVRGPWNMAFFDELEAFSPGNEKLHDDQVDALSGAYSFITAAVQFEYYEV